MTACNVIRKPDAIHILSDGLGLQGGAASFLATKVLPVPHMRAALCVRGDAGLLGALAIGLFMRAGTFDEAADAMPRLLSDAFAPAIALGPLPPDAQAELILAGWSEKHDRPECWVTPTHDLYGEAFTLIPFGDGLVQPLAAHDGLWARATTDPTFDVETDGLALLRLQRDTPGMQVGGFAQLTSVFRDRIETKILERWTGQ